MLIEEMHHDANVINTKWLKNGLFVDLKTRL